MTTPRKHTKRPRGLYKKPPVCKHPPARIYAWIAYDGTFCAGCCDCGTVLTGRATLLNA